MSYLLGCDQQFFLLVFDNVAKPPLWSWRRDAEVEIAQSNERPATGVKTLGKIFKLGQRVFHFDSRCIFESANSTKNMRLAFAGLGITTA